MKKTADEITCPVCKGKGGYYSDCGSNPGYSWYLCSFCYGCGRIPGVKMDIEIKGLSLTQPYASLVAIGAKPNETRSWQTSYRGWVAIHAASKFTDRDVALASRAPFRTALRAAGIDGVGCLPLGCFTALVELVSIEPTNRLDPATVSEIEMAFGNYDKDRFVWHTDNIIKLADEIPFKASQRLFDIPAPVAKRILKAAGINQQGNGKAGLFMLCPKCKRGVEAMSIEVADFVKKYGCGDCREKEADAAFSEAAGKTERVWLELPYQA